MALHLVSLWSGGLEKLGIGLLVTGNDWHSFDWQAIEFAKEQNDEELWDDLINYSLDKPGIWFSIA